MANDDDFLSDIENAVSGIQTPEAPDPITSLVKKEQAPAFDEAELVDELVGEKKPTTAKKETSEKQQEQKKPVEEKKAPETVDEKKDNNSQQQQQQQQKKSVAFMDRFFPEDANGNLLMSDGSVLVAAGQPRAVLEGLKKEARDQRQAASTLALKHIELSEQFKQLYDQYSVGNKGSADYATSIAEQTGMKLAEVNDAISLMKQYKSDPLAAIKSLLTQAHASGIDISSLGVKTALDIPTLVKMLKQNQEAETKETVPANDDNVRLEQARNEVKDFMQRNPDAWEHRETIALAKKQFPDASLDEIWLHYQQWQVTQDQAASKAEAERDIAVKPTITRFVKATPAAKPQVDYSRMSFEEIANHIKDELNNAQA